MCFALLLELIILPIAHQARALVWYSLNIDMLASSIEWLELFAHPINVFIKVARGMSGDWHKNLIADRISSIAPEPFHKAEWGLFKADRHRAAPDRP